MPWLEFYCPELTQDQKKNLATQFTETISRILNAPKDFVGIKFDTYKPDCIWNKQGFLSEKPGDHMYHLCMFAPPLKLEQKKELHHNITQIVAKVLNLNEQKQREFGISLQELPMENYSLGGKPVTEVLTAVK